MRTDLQRIAAEKEAERVVKEHGFTAPPVCPIEIAKRNDITVESKLTADPGVAGFLLRVGDAFGIMYSANVESPGFRRFTVAHELGHYFMPGHPEIIFREKDCHVSKFGFESSERHEREADFFATALLMPQALFKSAMNRHSPGIEAIKALSELFETSLTATAIRYAQLTPDPVAVLVSKGRSVEYCFLSETLQDLPRCRWPQKGTLLGPSTATARFNSNPQSFGSCAETYGTGTLDQWLSGAPHVSVHEDVIGLGAYGKTLTVIFSDAPIDTDDYQDRMEDEEYDEDDRLPSERWGSR